jgi:hypothetical protein
MVCTAGMRLWDAKGGQPVGSPTCDRDWINHRTEKNPSLGINICLVQETSQTPGYPHGQPEGDPPKATYTPLRQNSIAAAIASSLVMDPEEGCALASKNVLKLSPIICLCRATVFRGNGARLKAAHYFAGIGAWFVLYSAFRQTSPMIKRNLSSNPRTTVHGRNRSRSWLVGWLVHDKVYQVEVSRVNQLWRVDAGRNGKSFMLAVIRGRAAAAQSSCCYCR